MEKLFLKVSKKLYSKFKGSDQEFRNWNMFSNKTYSNKLISSYIESDKPCFIGRFGSTEMMNLVNYLGIKEGKKSYKSFIKGEALPWWWENKGIEQLHNWSGFFPKEPKAVETFCELMISDTSHLDVLGSWLKDERHFQDKLKGVKRLLLEDLEPFFSETPWTWKLEGKKVLVVHPFAETIESQYKKRGSLFENNLLPEFELKTIKAVQTIAGQECEFKDWFEALNFMKSQIDSIDFDICIIGAGAYGFPLGAHVKRIGKKAIHLGGVTQLLFGIKGNRWEDFIVWPYMNLFNENWVRPGELEKPKNATIVEGGCYW